RSRCRGAGADEQGRRCPPDGPAARGRAAVPDGQGRRAAVPRLRAGVGGGAPLARLAYVVGWGMLVLFPAGLLIGGVAEQWRGTWPFIAAGAVITALAQCHFAR